ncbi:Scramblase-domain-containing protein [Lactarius hengduanensis]|nr:Scramblase-domain-containing protein [Lactarius hengduanensis]
MLRLGLPVSRLSSISRGRQSPYFLRTFALSRFPRGGAPSGGRTRPRTPTPRARQGPTEHFEAQDDTSSDILNNPPLWEENQRPPASNPEHGLTRLLQNDSLVVTRQLEMLNIFIGFEQTNKYVISNEVGETLGFIAEEPRGLLASFSRQIFKTHRPFRAVIMDRDGTPILWIRRPFAWINSRMYVERLKDWHEYTPSGEPVLDTFAEAQQRWHLWRRRYDLFLRQDLSVNAPTPQTSFTDKVTVERTLSKAGEHPPEPQLEHFVQFSKIDEGFWAWHFTLRSSRGEELASISRAFRGFGREIFTDTGKSFTPLPSQAAPEDTTPREPYVIRELSLQERALVLAMAVNVDFDYFSRHSEGGSAGFWHFGWGSSD